MVNVREEKSLRKADFSSLTRANDRFWVRDFEFPSQKFIVGLGKSDSRCCYSLIIFLIN